MTESVDLSSVPRSVTQSTVLYFTFRTTTLAALPADRSSRKENYPSGPSAVANGACLANFFFSLQRYGGTEVRRYVPSSPPPTPTASNLGTSEFSPDCKGLLALPFFSHQSQYCGAPSHKDILLSPSPSQLTLTQLRSPSKLKISRTEPGSQQMPYCL